MLRTTVRSFLSAAAVSTTGDGLGLSGTVCWPQPAAVSSRAAVRHSPAARFRWCIIAIPPCHLVLLYLETRFSTYSTTPISPPAGRRAPASSGASGSPGEGPGPPGGRTAPAAQAEGGTAGAFLRRFQPGAGTLRQGRPRAQRPQEAPLRPGQGGAGPQTAVRRHRQGAPGLGVAVAVPSAARAQQQAQALQLLSRTGRPSQAS